MIATECRGRPLNKGRPKLMQVWQRHRELVTDDLPNYLDIHDDIYEPGGSWNPSRYPKDCAGPVNPDKNCGRSNFCLWCHERRRRADAIRAAMIHIGQPNLHRISIPLDKWGGIHPKHARDCLRRIAGVLQRHGFTRQSIWLHAFGDNPCDGVKSHIEGVVSGFDADPDVLDTSMPGGVGLILKRFQDDEDSAQPIKVEVERLHPHSRKHVDALVNHALDCATPSFPVKRLYAGLFMDKRGQVRSRITTVADGVRPMHIKDLPCKSQDHLPDATRDDLLTWAIVAEHWRESVSKPIMTRNVRVDPAFADLVLRATAWRGDFRLASDVELMDRWAAEPSVVPPIPA